MKFKAFCLIPHAGEIEIKSLVRCKECKWWKTHGATSERWLPCMDMSTEPNFYCARGEKEGNDAETDM